MSSADVTATPLAGFPFTPRYAEVGGHTMAYVDEGPPGVRDAPPVLLVHGNPTWSFHWRSLLHALPAAGFRAIAPDHIGMGRSAKPSRAEYPHTLERRVADLTEFVDGLGLDRRPALVVHDWGGPIGLSWAAAGDPGDPVRVDRLVLLNTAAFPLPAGKPLPWMLRAARLPVFGELAVRRLNAFSLGALVLGSGRGWLPAEARRGLLAPYDRPEHREAVHAFVQDIPTGPDDPAHAVLARLAARLPDLDTVPTSVFWGLRDPVFDEAILDHLVAGLPHARVERFPDAGHFVLEDAADRIVGPVTAFLSEGDRP